MKKKIILCLFVLVSLLTITGCGKSEGGSSSTNLHKAEFVDMKYNEPKNYSKKESTINMDNYKVLIYRFNEDDKKTINLYYNENVKAASTEEDYEVVDLNGTKCNKFRGEFGVIYDTYECIYNNALYTIELNEADKYQEEFDEFIKGVAFEK